MKEKLRWSESKDGVERTTVVVRIRLTREQVERARFMAVSENNDSWKDWINSMAKLGVEGDLCRDPFIVRG